MNDQKEGLGRTRDPHLSFDMQKPLDLSSGLARVVEAVFCLVLCNNRTIENNRSHVHVACRVDVYGFKQRQAPAGRTQSFSVEIPCLGAWTASVPGRNSGCSTISGLSSRVVWNRSHDVKHHLQKDGKVSVKHVHNKLRSLEKSRFHRRFVPCDIQCSQCTRSLLSFPCPSLRLS